MNYKVVQITGKKIENDPRLRFIPEDFLDYEGMDVLGAVDKKGELLGALAYCAEGFVVRIAFIYVDDDHRRKGIANALIDELTMIVLSDPTGYLIETYFPDGEYEDYEKMLLSRGDFITYRETALFSEGKSVKKDRKLYDMLLSYRGQSELFYTLSGRVQRAFLDRLKARHINDMVFLWDEKEPDKDLCFCKLAGNRVTAAVFARADEEDAVIFFMYAESGNDLLDPLSRTLQEIKKKYPKSRITFTNLHEGTSILVKGLLGK